MDESEQAGNGSGNTHAIDEHFAAREKIVWAIEACLTSDSANDEAELVLDVLMAEMKAELAALIWPRPKRASDLLASILEDWNSPDDDHWDNVGGR